MQTEYVKPLLLRQVQTYPALCVQDLVKALYQAEFGCGHFVQPGEAGLRYLLSELENVPADADVSLTEPLGPDYCRIHLQSLPDSGLSPRTLQRLFHLSSLEPAGDMSRFRQHLSVLEDCIAQGELPNPDPDFLDPYRETGCPATHHSQRFRDAYHPAYRVVAVKYARLIPLLARIDRLLDEQAHVNIAIEGGSASGKSTLAALLAKIYEDSSVFHMDDFFLQRHQRTPERFAEPGGNVDRERFREEVLDPLSKGEPFTYRVFDCTRMALGDAVHVTPGRLRIIEGAYSMHPFLADAYDLSVFLMIDQDKQAQRILQRNGEAMLRRFREEWIPLENRYFSACALPERCMLTLKLSD